MNEIDKKYDIGILIGRFQVHELHEAHKELIDTAISKHEKVMIFIGLSAIRGTRKNPLTFQSRKKMIEEAYPDVDVFYIDDNRSDDVWSKNLDQQINKWKKPTQKAVLYGSRDSFIPHYTGSFPVKELESTINISATTIRKRIANNFKDSPEFRAGIISSTFDRYDSCFPTVDIVVHNKQKNLFLVGKKPGEPHYRFVGGFVDPHKDECLEDSAKRELSEEAGDFEISNLQYICSCKIDDWRYRSESDKIMTSFFYAEYNFGPVKAGDDLEEIKWMTLEDLSEDIMPEHIPLLKKLYGHLKIEW